MKYILAIGLWLLLSTPVNAQEVARYEVEVGAAIPLIAKKYGALVTRICDVCFACLAGVPFAALLLFFRSGILGYFMAAGFLIGLALPICLQPALNTATRRRENQKEQKIR